MYVLLRDGGQALAAVNTNPAVVPLASTALFVARAVIFTAWVPAVGVVMPFTMTQSRVPAAIW